MIYIVILLLIYILGRMYGLYGNKYSSIAIHKNSKKKYCVIVSIIFILLISLRCLATGKDTLQYQYVFNSQYEYHSFIKYVFDSKTYEYGYYLWQWMLHYIVDYRGYLFFQAVLMVVPFTYVIYKRSDNVVISMMLYVLLSFLTWNMSIARQGPAISLIFLAYYFYSMGKYAKAFLVFVLSVSFHVTSLVFLFAVLFLKLLRNDKLLIGGILTSKLLGTFLLPYILPYMRVDYSESIQTESVGQLTYWGFLMLLLMMLWLKRYKKIVLYNNFYLFSFVLILWPMADTISAAFRITFYFLIYLTLCIPSVYSQMNAKKQNTFKYIKIVIFVICFGYFYNQHYGNRSRCVYPYYSVFEYGDDKNIPKLYEDQ